MAPDPNGPPGVTCAGLAKTWPGGVKAVLPTDLSFAAGQTTALVGASGCGKSTLLRMIAGLETPSAGTITIGGEPPSETLRKAGLSVAFQDPSLLPWRSVRGNIELALSLARRPVDRAAIDQLIALVGLDGFSETRPAGSGGRQAATRAIARRLFENVRLLCFDEPSGGFDERDAPKLAQDAALGRPEDDDPVTHCDRAVAVRTAWPRRARRVGDIASTCPAPRPRSATAISAHSSVSPRVAGGALAPRPLPRQ